MTLWSQTPGWRSCPRPSCPYTKGGPGPGRRPAGASPLAAVLARYLDLMLMTPGVAGPAISGAALVYAHPLVSGPAPNSRQRGPVLGTVTVGRTNPSMYLGIHPGKWLLGLRVRRLDGRKLAWDQAVERLFLVLWRGQGLCIPLYREWRSWMCFGGLHRRETIALGEGEPGCMAQPIRRGRWVAGGLLGCYDGPVRCEPAVEPGAAPSRRTVDSYPGSGELQFL